METAVKEYMSLKSSYRNYLGNVDFHWFVTLTFKELILFDDAKRRFHRWLRKINETLYGRRFRRKKLGASFVITTEYQKREVLHFHALIGGDVCNLNRNEWKKKWENNCFQKNKKNINGFARIEKFDPIKGGLGYVTKSIITGDEIDYFISKKDMRYLQA